MPSMNTTFFSLCSRACPRREEENHHGREAAVATTFSASREITISSDDRVGYLFLSFAHLAPIICLHSDSIMKTCKELLAQALLLTIRRRLKAMARS